MTRGFSLASITRKTREAHEKRETLADVLGEFVSKGQLTLDDVARVTRAQRYSLRIREALSYLAGIVMFIGAGFTVAPAFRNSSPVGIAVILYVVGAIFASASWRLYRTTDWKKRLSEVFEFAATVAFAVATGIVLAQANVSVPLAVLLVALASAAWGFVRRAHSVFACALLLTAGVLVSTFALVVWTEPSEDTGTLFFVVASAILLRFGTMRLSLAFIPRAAGSVALVICAFTWYGNHESVPWTLVVLAIGVALFVAVSPTPWREMLVASAIIVVAGTVVLAARLVTNDVARGAVMLAIGGLTLGAVGWYARRTNRRSVS